jgi:hypothetical protein
LFSYFEYIPGTLQMIRELSNVAFTNCVGLSRLTLVLPESNKAGPYRLPELRLLVNEPRESTSSLQETGEQCRQPNWA